MFDIAQSRPRANALEEQMGRNLLLREALAELAQCRTEDEIVAWAVAGHADKKGGRFVTSTPLLRLG